MPILVRVHWDLIESDVDERWDWTRVLYAYTVPPRDEIVYIGKADGRTVRERWNRSSKEDFWKALEREQRMFRHGVLVGDLELEGGARLTRELLADIESSLIHRVQPWGNIQACYSRISRPGLRVLCFGKWPFARASFVDRG